MRQADALAMSVSGALDRIALPLSGIAAALVRDEVWFELGFARLEDYARERFGRSGRWVREMASLGDALDRMPALAAALTGDDGGRPLGVVAAMLIGRIAHAESVAAWVRLARTVSVRELRAEVRQSRANGSDCPSGGGSGLESSPVPGVSLPAARDVDDSDAPQELVRMPVPAHVKAAFDEALELFRANEGHTASVTAFVEALVAETVSGPVGLADVLDFDRTPVHHDDAAAATESALCHSTGCWAHLPDRSASSWALALAGATLSRFEQLSAGAGRGNAVGLDRQMRDLLEIEDDLQRRLGDLFAEMSRLGAWQRLGFDGCAHYAEQRLGISRSSAGERLQAARTLRRLPLVWRAYEQGEIGLESALHIYRMMMGAGRAADIADPTRLQAVEQRWLDLARTATVKRMRDEARLYGRALAGVRWDDSDPPWTWDGADGPSDDASWHASLRREPGMARARVARWGQIVVEGLARDADNRTSVPDVFLRLRLPAELAADLMAAVSAVCRRLASCPGPNDTRAPASLRAAQHLLLRGRRVPAWAGLLAMLEEFVDVWDAGARARGDEVYVRDGYRCTAPGCSSRRNLEDHHIVYRSEGGKNELSNRTCLCRFHHQRGEHGGLASCRGLAPLGIVWSLGRHGAGGRFVNERLE